MATTAQQIIDLIMYRYGKPSNTTDARAEALRYANIAQGLLWVDSDWPWKREETTLTLTNNTNKYELPDATADVFWVKNVSGKPLKHVPPRTFRSVYLQDTTTGHPLAYTVDGRTISNTEQKLILWVWPKPVTATGAGTATVGYEIALPDMTDSASSYARVPDRLRDLLCVWALELMTAQQNNPSLFQMYNAERQDSLAKARAQYMTVERDKR